MEKFAEKIEIARKIAEKIDGKIPEKIMIEGKIAEKIAGKIERLLLHTCCFP